MQQQNIKKHVGQLFTQQAGAWSEINISPESSEFFVYAGVHFKACPIELRELFATVYDLPNLQEIVAAHAPNVQEFVPISTCNRFDFCLFGKANKQELISLFLTLAQIQYEKKIAKENKCPTLNLWHENSVKKIRHHIDQSLRYSADENSLILFFQVAASLDSLVIGEPQVFGQIKQFYSLAQKKGFAGKLAARIFDRCFSTVKRIRNETDLFKNVVSIGHAALNLVEKELEYLPCLTEKNILIVGAGEIAKTTAKYFVSKGFRNLSITNRTLNNAQKLVEQIGTGQAVELGNALKNIHTYSACLVAVSGEHYVIDKEIVEGVHHCALAKNLSQEEHTRREHIIFVDMSVPRKINPNIGTLPQIKLFNIDSLQFIVDKNQKIRADSALAAQKIIKQEVFDYSHKISMLFEKSDLALFHNWVHSVVQKEVDLFFKKKKNKPALKSTIIAQSVAKKMVKKVLAESKTGAK